MSNSLYTIRNYRPADFDNYVQLALEAKKLEPTGRCTSPQVISEDLHRPNYSPEQDLFLVEIAGEIVGYLDITPELDIRRVILSCFIHPDHRRYGLASGLFAYAMSRAKELEAKVAHVNILQDNSLAKIVLPKLGFRLVRRFLELRLDLTKVCGWNVNQAGMQCRHLQHGDEETLAHIQNRSFAGTWGYNPNTVEEIIYKTNLSGFSPEDVVLACYGDKVIGYCWTRTACTVDAAKRIGQIFMLGVDPDYRGRGIGRKVLLAGLSYLESKGLQATELSVDSENKTAFALYRSIGFKVRTSSLWYEKRMS